MVAFRGSVPTGYKQRIALGNAHGALGILMSVFHDRGRCWSDENLQALKEALELLAIAGGCVVPNLGLHPGDLAQGPGARGFEGQKRRLWDLTTRVMSDPGQRTEEMRQEMLQLITGLVNAIHEKYEDDRRIKF